MSALPKRERVTQFTPSSNPTPIDMTVLNNEKAERAVVGAVFQRPDLFPTLSHLLQPTDFWALFLGLCWYVVDKMIANDENVNIVTIADAIEKEKSNPYKGDEEALMNALSSLYGACPDIDHAEDFARQVRESAMVCRVIKTLDTTKSDILTGNLRGEELKDELNRRVFEATEQTVERKSDASSMMNAYVDGFEGGELAATVPTGLHHLDGLLSGHGFFPKEVCVWVGAAGMGKTTALLSIARHVARSKRSVALFTMEMEQSEISQALIAMETGIPRGTLQSKRISPAQYNAIVEASGAIGSWDLHTIDMHEFPALKPLQLKRKLRSLMVNNPIDLVILDGLWLMEPNKEIDDRPKAVAAIMRDLSGIAKQFNIPILLAHQYTRLSGRTYKKPTLELLAESAGVERNAQVVIGMWRQSYFDDNESNETFAHVLKNRNRGMLGSAPIGYNAQFNRFGNDNE